MGLTITATFEKQGIYFAGDTLECHIRFENAHSAASSADIGSPGRAGNGLMSQLGLVSTHSRRPSQHQTVSRISTSRPPAHGATADDAPFPGLDNGSEYSSGPALAPGIGRRRYSAVAGTEDGSHSSAAAPLLAAKHPSASRGREGSGSGLGPSAHHRRTTGLAAFPALSASLPGNTGQFPRSDALQPFSTSSSRKASAHGGRVISGTFSERMARQELPTIEPRGPPPVPGARKPSNAAPGDNLFPRLSTSSVLSTPTASLASWLPFGGARQPDAEQDQLRRTTFGSQNGGPASDAGSGSSFLGSLWRNLSGGSNAPSQLSTRNGAAAEDHGIERLAIGFAEAAGSLALSTSYIKPDQLGQLLRHKGTSYGTSPGVRSPPIGGGLGSWVPTSPSTHSASRTQKSFPILISSPAVLFSELELAPGESQTFSIRVQLPKALPPSFRGRVACVSYDLVVVAKRNMLEANAHIVRIPFRVLAHVSSQQPVALSFNQPIRMPPESIQLTFQETAPVSTPRNASPSLEIDDDGLPYLLSESDTAGEGSLELDDQSAVIESLYEQLTGSTVLRRCIELVEQERGSPGASPVLVPSDDGEHAGADMSGRSRSDVEDGVMASIDDVCRRRAPVEFSLSQSGQAVASVWLPKRAYRLGDMVAGTVRLHTGRPGIYQVSIWLESVETINDQFSSYDGERNEELTRKVVADHHQFCRYNRTLGFALACPPTAAASFGSDIMSNVWQLRIELIIARPASLVSDLALSATAPFPPPRLQRTGTPAASRNGALRVQSPPSTPTSPTRLSSLPAAAQGRQFRTRSSTMAEGSIRPPILSPAAEQPRSSFVDDRQLAEPAAVKYGPLRRRYDAVAEVPVQTLSCTVTIQMYPPPSKELIPGHRDSHLIDLARRT